MFDRIKIKAPTSMKIYFSHGKESGPWGTKIKRLAATAGEYNCEVDSIDYTDTLDPDLRVERLVNILKAEEEKCILVGSSMGGYVALMASCQVQAHAVFLMAPALYMRGYKEEYCSGHKHLEIVHGWSDDIIPPEHSIRYAREADCTLHMISGDHPLNSSIEHVDALFRQFLKNALLEIS